MYTCVLVLEGKNFHRYFKNNEILCGEHFYGFLTVTPTYFSPCKLYSQRKFHCLLENRNLRTFSCSKVLPLSSTVLLKNANEHYYYRMQSREGFLILR